MQQNKSTSYLFLSGVFSYTGFYILLTTVSILNYRASNNVVDSSLIFSSQWFALFIFSPLIAKISGSKNIGFNLLYAELLTALCIGLCVLFYDNFTIMILMSLALGFLNGIRKTTKPTLLKMTTSEEKISFASSLLVSSEYIGGFICGMFTKYFMGSLTSAQLIFSGLLFSLCGALITTPLMKEKLIRKTAKSGGLFHEIKIGWIYIVQNSNLKYTMTLLMMMILCVQSFYDSTRTFYPLKVLNLNDEYVELLQVYASIATLAGPVFISMISQLKFYRSLEKKATQLVLLTLIWFPLFPLLPDWQTGFAVYTLMLFIYESNYTLLINDLMKNADSDHIGPVFSAAFSVIPMTLSFFIPFISYLFDHFEFSTICQGLFALALVMNILMTWISGGLKPERIIEYKSEISS